jgi:hypothetical protein
MNRTMVGRLVGTLAIGLLLGACDGSVNEFDEDANNRNSSGAFDGKYDVCPIPALSSLQAQGTVTDSGQVDKVFKGTVDINLVKGGWGSMWQSKCGGFSTKPVKITVADGELFSLYAYAYGSDKIGILVLDSTGAQKAYKKMQNILEPQGPEQARKQWLRGVYLGGGTYYVLIVPVSMPSQEQSTQPYSLRIMKGKTQGQCGSFENLPNKYMLQETWDTKWFNGINYNTPRFEIVGANNQIYGWVTQEWQDLTLKVPHTLETLGVGAHDSRTICWQDNAGDVVLCTTQYDISGKQSAPYIYVWDCNGELIGSLQYDIQSGSGSSLYYIYSNSTGYQNGDFSTTGYVARSYKLEGIDMDTDKVMNTTFVIKHPTNKDAVYATMERVTSRAEDGWSVTVNDAKFDPRLYLTAAASKTSSDNRNQVSKCTHTVTTNPLNNTDWTKMDCQKCCDTNGHADYFTPSENFTSTYQGTCYDSDDKPYTCTKVTVSSHDVCRCVRPIQGMEFDVTEN